MGKLRVLDLTNPKAALEWGYLETNNYNFTRPVAAKAIQQGYNAIKFPSLRSKGFNNYAIFNNLSDINDILAPQMIMPVK